MPPAYQPCCWAQDFSKAAVQATRLGDQAHMPTGAGCGFIKPEGFVQMVLDAIPR